jgi:hypothetical protein
VKGARLVKGVCSVQCASVQEQAGTSNAKKQEGSHQSIYVFNIHQCPPIQHPTSNKPTIHNPQTIHNIQSINQSWSLRECPQFHCSSTRPPGGPSAAKFQFRLFRPVGLSLSLHLHLLHTLLQFYYTVIKLSKGNKVMNRLQILLTY